MDEKFDTILDYLLQRLDIATQTYAISTLHNNKEFMRLAREGKEVCKKEVIFFIKNELWFYKHEIADLSGNDDIYEEE